MNIQELFELIERNNKPLLAQQSAESAALKGVSVAKGQRLPDVNTSLSVSYIGNALLTGRHLDDAHGLSSPHMGNNFSLAAEQLVYAGGAIDAGVKKAELQSQQAEASTSMTRLQQRFLALGQYLELKKIDLRIKVVNENIALSKSLIANITDKMEQGLALKNDVTRYELQLQNLNLELTQLQNNREIVNHQLCNSLGIDVNERIEPIQNVEQEQYGHDSEQVWQQTAATNSPALQMSVLSEKQAQQDERIALSELRPKISIFAADNFNGPITYELPPIDKNINVWYVGVGISYPISSLFKSNRKVKQSRLITQSRQQQTLAEQERLSNEMQQAHTLYEQAYVELQTQSKKVELAHENYEVMKDRYLNQLALVTDMVDASNVKLDAELQEVDARINIAYAYYRMKYVAGTL